jgi:hypothetical protein
MARKVLPHYGFRLPVLPIQPSAKFSLPSRRKICATGKTVVFYEDFVTKRRLLVFATPRYPFYS